MSYRFDYQDDSDAASEQILFDGITAHAILKKSVKNPIKSFGIFIKDTNENVL